MPINNPTQTVRTRTIFAPAQQKASGATLDWPGALIAAAGKNCFSRIQLPDDFTAVTNLFLILRPQATGASMMFDIVTSWASRVGGEQWNVHTETAAARDVGATVAGEYMSHDIKDLFNVANPINLDLLIVQVSYSAAAIASNAHIQGVRLKYY